MSPARAARGAGLVAAIGLAALAMTASVHAGDVPLRRLAAERGFFVGAAVAMVPFRYDKAYRTTLSREYNMLVAENAFKWERVHVGRDTYSFDDTDALVDFAEANGMAVRGHTLVWHRQLPRWLTGAKWSREEAIAILRDHIETVVGRYKGRVAAWDVVNEAIDDGGRMRRSIWYRTIGPDYVKLALRFAHAADPAAKLYYNDYSAEDMSLKADAVYDLVKGLKADGVPIDGVGWQMHLRDGAGIGRAQRENAARLAALGLDLTITELDIRLHLPPTPQAMRRQADTYGAVTTFCLSQPNCKAMVTWGFSDGYSWVPGFFDGYGDALIFDADYRPKPAYEAVSAALAAGR